MATNKTAQFESTCAVLNGRVIVAYVDSNEGVYYLGGDPQHLPSYTPRLVGFSVSEDGGATFQDKGVPPLARSGTPSNDDGDAGDPVLAVDTASETLYLVGTSPRNSGYKGIPLWKSTDGGLTFGNALIVRDDIIDSDKPWLAVDNAAGTGQHDGYLGCSGRVGALPNQTNGIWLSVSTDGSLGSWSAPLLVRRTDADDVIQVQSLIPVAGPVHVTYGFWQERTSDGTNWIKMRTIGNRGSTLGDIRTVAQLATTNSQYGNLELLRSNNATNTDNFRAFPFPVPAVNPIKTNHLYVAYADRGTNSGDKADIFFLSSTNGGTNWTSPLRVNTVWTNDQWMPVLAVKPDGTQLFMAWYDRRNDTNNSLIDLYGRFGSIAGNGDVTFSTNDFRLTTANFPPVFAGSDTNNLPDGHYDPVYPPGLVNLHWWYSEWSSNPALVTSDAFKGHVGEYNGALADAQYVYTTWTDYRLPASGTLYGRYQADIRAVRISWPQ
jgi:hypothetical protein